MAGLEGTLHTPLGAVNKKTALIVGGLFAGIFAIGWYRNKKAKQTASSATSAIDPATGYPYGSPEDAAALTSQNQYQMAGSSSGGNISSGISSGTITPGSFTNNAEWTQYVEQILTSGGEVTDATGLGNALGTYLAGEPLTADQISLVNQAIAVGGKPPIAGPSGFPPAYNTTPTPVPTAAVPGAPTGASARPTSGTTVDIWWQPVANATGYTVWARRSGSNDVWMTVGSVIASSANYGGGTNITARGLSPHTRYDVVVRAENSTGYGPYSDTITVSTP